ncbi:ABC transporter substrate-binding protein [Tenggerimyces flavus]|uniref:ABC transporter substrate-binding protein n=1 Tax=Tenggerimyces flavus TaxID=1708749 RepID=A0ABV7Y7K8_9ACTN|nr:ABC transporter substrate-binding protein [Tenggerimyces flavus]MBM7791163.1 polar amino acid transport system substrate-binding protein [Tenggerimyces flavus]
MRAPAVLALAAAAALAVAACAPEDPTTSAPTDQPSATTPTASSDPCATDGLPVRTKGKLTIATDQPVYGPWFEDDKPESGKGFEGAVAYAVAKEMGFEQPDVVWTRVKFNNAIQPGPKDFDFDINEFSITEDRKKAVDFSSPYYDVSQAIIALEGSKIANAESLADLKDARLGAQVSTTSYSVITDLVKPTVEPRVFPNNDNAKLSLQNGQIDGLVVDLPTAFYMTGAEIEGSKVVGQFELGQGTPEQFGLVLDKGSPLTTCVSRAVDALREDGTLDDLAQEWLADVAGAPVLGPG